MAALILAGCGSRSIPDPAADGGGIDAGPDADVDDCPPCQGPDLDGDGVPGPPCRQDCDDTDPTVAEGLPDPTGDGRDTDCDGADGVDRDGDGFVAAAAGGDDCDDFKAYVRPGAPDGQGWVIEPFPAGIRTQLGLDRWGRPVVAWVGRDPETSCYDDEWVELDGYSTVELSRWQRGEWTTQVVARACTNEAISVGVGSDGTTWLAFAGSESSSRLSVANDGSRRWVVEDLGPGSNAVALVIDHCRPAVVYSPFPWSSHSESSSAGLAWREADWHYETFGEGHRGTLFDVAVAPDGQFAASYVLDTADEEHPLDLALAVRSSDQWQTQIIDEEGWWPQSDTAVGFVPSGDLVAAYGDRYGLWLVSNDRGWSRSNVDERPLDFGYTCCQMPGAISMQVGGDGTVHVAYAPLAHVSYATNDGDGWTVQDLAEFTEEIVQNGYPSLALDADGGVHVAWYVQDFDVDPDLPPEMGRYASLARPNDGVDQNCDGVDGVDADGDGRASVETGGDDVDDTVPD